jgi:NADH-quinone oxidoreductase subunit E
MSFEFTTQTRQKFDTLVCRYPKKKAATLWGLWLTQWQEGYVPMDAFDYLAQELECTAMEVYQVATFHTMFHIGKPIGRYHIQLCKTLSCKLNGSEALLHAIEKELGIKSGETTKDGKFTLSLVECQAACGGAPMVCLNEEYHENLTPDALLAILRGCA